MHPLQLMLLLSIFFGFSSCETKNESQIYDFAIIPKPQQLSVGSGSFLLNQNSSIYAEDDLKIASEFLQSFLAQGAGFEIRSAARSEAKIIIEKDSLLPKEGYNLEVSEKNILLKAADPGGAFYGVQTLRQLLPPSFERASLTPISEVWIPEVLVTDAPKFSYRGMHLDVGRHFFS